ncbi:MAG: magnesium transporter MgtC [Candidatus Aenigmarchaeota archaeon]|nr:magnesium transporter MgtC [Candidatus Aenigmarchaeota archaeon]
MIDLIIVIKIIIATICGGIIGYEREISRKAAGLRTHILVCLGSAIFTVLSLQAFPGADTSRVAAYIIAGIGFIGAGTVIQTKEKVIGLTTAASLWITASIGMAVGSEFYILALIATIISYFTLKLGKLEKKKR